MTVEELSILLKVSPHCLDSAKVNTKAETAVYCESESIYSAWGLSLYPPFTLCSFPGFSHPFNYFSEEYRSDPAYDCVSAVFYDKSKCLFLSVLAFLRDLEIPEIGYYGQHD